MKKKDIGKLKKAVIMLIVLVSSVLTYFGIDLFGENNSNTVDNGQTSYVDSGSNAEIHYLDVGQGDAIYIKVNGKNILIDAGPKDASDKLVKQLKDLNVNTLDMVFASHPHEDHIGGMVSIFKNFSVKSFYMPKVTHTTKTFNNMITEVDKAGLKIQNVKSGMSIDLGKGAEFKIFSPVKDSYEELNNYSPIMKFTYGKKSFMFTADAEVLSEKEVLKKFDASELKSDVLKVGHHGSTTSTCDEFLNAVNPEIAVISLGAGNSYGHPHKEIMEKLNGKKLKIYRTDTQGQITIITDGENLNIKTEK